MPRVARPRRNRGGGQLGKAEKQENRRLASQRIGCEHVIGKLKVFKILAEHYRNRRRRFGLRVHLLAALYNFALLHPRSLSQEVSSRSQGGVAERSGGCQQLGARESCSGLGSRGVVPVKTGIQLASSSGFRVARCSPGMTDFTTERTL